MEAKVSRGHLEVHDEKGSYRIPVGRRSRKTLMILDQKEGEYIRSLELDLFTGFVYYCVDNATEQRTGAAKKPCHQVEAEKTHKTPVKRTDNYENQANFIKH